MPARHHLARALIFRDGVIGRDFLIAEAGFLAAGAGAARISVASRISPSRTCAVVIAFAWSTPKPCR
jgi:hypothetical protein